jgi:hypothetical protein
MKMKSAFPQARVGSPRNDEGTEPIFICPHRKGLSIEIHKTISIFAFKWHIGPYVIEFYHKNEAQGEKSL